MKVEDNCFRFRLELEYSVLGSEAVAVGCAITLVP